MKQRAPFQPLDPYVDDKIENLAREKGVGALVKPLAGEQGPAPVSAPPAPTLVTGQRNAVTAPDTASFDSAAVRTPMKTLNVELPDYVWTALKIRAAEQKASVRHIIMTALRRDGIEVNEIDMIYASLRTRSLKSKVQR